MFTNNAGISLPLAVWLAHDTYDHSEDSNTISATGLIKPIRQIILGSRIPVEDRIDDVLSQVSSSIGTAIHDSIETAWKKHYKEAMLSLGYPQKVIDAIKINPTKLEEGDIPVYLEQRISKKIGKWTVSGKYDAVFQGVVTDYKSTKTYGFTKDTNNESYRLQGSIYRWLAPEIITEDILSIQYIFTDWSKVQAVIGKTYPPTPVLEKKFQLLSMEETEKYITNRLNEIESMWNKPQAELPVCSPDDLWRSESVWKYYKDPNKTARSTKNFDNQMDASARMAKEGKGTVIKVEGKVRRCGFCPALSICTQKDQYILDSSLVI